MILVDTISSLLTNHYFIGNALVALLSIILGLFLTSDCDLYLRFCSYDKNHAYRGKVVWIIGASSGIGASLAVDIARAGGQLILSARREDLLKIVATNCESNSSGLSDKFGKPKPAKPFIITLDILDEKSVVAAHEKILERYGRVDIAVLNAGKGQRALVMDTTVSVAEDLVKLNYLSFVGITHAVLPDMLKRKSGHIVALSSMAGKIGTPISASYSASKFAIVSIYIYVYTYITSCNHHNNTLLD
jgi:short-subunit dehydrogenase